MAKRQPAAKSVEALRHSEDKRKNIPTAELESVMKSQEPKNTPTIFEPSVWQTRRSVFRITARWISSPSLPRMPSLKPWAAT